MPSVDESKCILVTGATSGIGRALALRLATLPTKPRVIASGKRKERLQELVEAGLESVEMDVDTDNATLKKFAESVIQQYPDLDTVIYSAGVQYECEFTEEVNRDNLTSEININYTSIVLLITHFLPHFLRLSEQGKPTFIIPITSGLAAIPAPWVSNYCATKAALHSFTMSLRLQMQKTNVNVIEIAPPYVHPLVLHPYQIANTQLIRLVESELHDPEESKKLAKFWMSLGEFTSITVDGLRKGDKLITCGGAEGAFKRFEEGKEELAAQFGARRNQWTKD